MTDEGFKSWAVVEVMGHQTYSGFVTAENIAGAPMLRVDVPEVGEIPAFTKYIAPSALYGITPCTEATATAMANTKKKTPFETWGVEKALMAKLKEAGKLVETKAIEYKNDDDDDVIDPDFDPDDDDPEF
jgi:hypothetical protein